MVISHGLSAIMNYLLHYQLRCSESGHHPSSSDLQISGVHGDTRYSRCELILLGQAPSFFPQFSHMISTINHQIITIGIAQDYLLTNSWHEESCATPDCSERRLLGGFIMMIVTWLVKMTIAFHELWITNPWKQHNKDSSTKICMKRETYVGDSLAEEVANFLLYRGDYCDMAMLRDLVIQSAVKHNYFWFLCQIVCILKWTMVIHLWTSTVSTFWNISVE